MVHQAGSDEAGSMSTAPARPGRARPPVRLAAWLPQGRALSDADFAWRHRVVCILLALHIPAIMVITVLRGYGALHGLAEVLPVVVLLGVALAPLRRRQQ